nr:MAG TPA: hypothetical protein [Caudoviricetes sp.]
MSSAFMLGSFFHVKAASRFHLLLINFLFRQ